jgi:iron complex outermembrane recepter protein
MSALVRWLAASVSCAGLPMLTNVHAAERSAALEEVIVTAQKQSERLQDVPVPVSAIAADILTSSNQLQIQDYYSKVPGLGLTLAGNGGEPVVTIRGIATGVDSNPTVGLVVDEVPYGASVVAGGGNTPFAVDIDPGDLAHVEVLRGPQGTLYGASSMGGLLKFVTVDPSTDRISGRVQLGSASISHGDDFGYSVRGAINVPLSDEFAVRGSAFTTREPGYIDNAETGQEDVNRRDSTGGRLSALWRPSDSFSLKLNALIQENERLGTDDVDSALGGDPQQSFLRGTGRYDRDTDAYSAIMTGKIGSIEWVSATGYSKDEMRDDIDTTTFAGGVFAALGGAFFGTDRAVTEVHAEVEKFSQELRASIPLTDNLTWLVGAFYTDEDTTRTNDTRAADSSGARPATIFKNAVDGQKYEERALFTNVTFDISSRWDIQVGGRYSEDKQTAPFVSSGPLAGIIFGADPFAQPTLKSTGNAFTYLVTPRFRISPDLMVYMRVASGYRPGGPNPVCGGVDSIPCSFDSDTTENYDVGIKGTALDGALSFDASIYYIDWKDIQIAGILSPTTTVRFTGNVGGAKSQGIELSFGAKPTDGFTLSAWGSYNDAQLTEDFPTGQIFGQSGDRLPYGARTSGSLSADQEFPLGSSLTGSIGASISYVGDRKGAFQPTPVREEYPSYTQVDLRGRIGNGSWDIDLFVNNATDKRGILRSGLDAALFPTYVTYIQPRTMGLSFTKSF